MKTGRRVVLYNGSGLAHKYFGTVGIVWDSSSIVRHKRCIIIFRCYSFDAVHFLEANLLYNSNCLSIRINVILTAAILETDLIFWFRFLLYMSIYYILFFSHRSLLGRDVHLFENQQKGVASQ